MQFRLRTLLILMAVGPPTVGIAWAIRDESASHRLPELHLIVGTLLIFLLTLYPLTIAAAWAVDSTVAIFSYRHKR